MRCQRVLGILVASYSRRLEGSISICARGQSGRDIDAPYCVSFDELLEALGGRGNVAWILVWVVELFAAHD